MKKALHLTLCACLLILVSLSSCQKEKLFIEQQPPEKSEFAATITALETMTIPSGQAIPTGWIITSRSSNYVTITNIVGLATGYQLQIVGGQNTPAGWIVTSTTALGDFKVITRIEGYPTGTQVTIVGGQNTPAGWIVTNTTALGDTKVITRIEGYPAGTTVIIITGQPTPSGWIVIATTSGTKTIKKL